MTGMVAVRRAERGDAEAILPLISRQTLDEYEVIGASPASMVAGAFEAGAPVFVSTLDDRPMAIFGFTDYGSYTSMWTLATQAYFEAGVPAIIKTRAFLRKLDFGKPLCVVTFAPHADTDRWLGLLGFEKIAHDGARRDFLYPRR